MISGRHWVVDTNTLVSHLLSPRSLPSKAVQKALSSGDLLVSEHTLEELADVLARPKFEKYLSRVERQSFFRVLSRVAIRITILRPIRACRDPKDDKFLEVAINGRADAIISGDTDLLEIHPFLGIPILSPRSFIIHIS